MNSEISIFNDRYWIARGSRKLLTYIGLPLEKKLRINGVRRFVKQKGAWGAMWNYDHDYTENGKWYRCICDNKDYNETCIPSKNARHNLRRGLKRCNVKKIDTRFLAESGYNVYVEASARYNNFNLETEQEFQNRMNKIDKRDDAEAFGVFVKDQLVAYMTVFVRQNSAWGNTAAFNPNYSNAYPMYALYYEVARYYLQERGLEEFDRGSRPLRHETNIDNFLLRIGYRKAYCRLGVYYNHPVTMVLAMARIFKRIYKVLLPSKYSSILDGLLLAQDIAKSTSVEEGENQNQRVNR